MTPQTLLELADRVEAVGIEHAQVLAERGGGTMWAKMAHDCLAAAASLRAIAARTKGNEE